VSTRAFLSPARPGFAALGLWLSLGVVPLASAQTRFRIGLQSGLHLSTYVGGEASARARLVPGLTAGLLASWHWSARQGLQVEARYAQKGASLPDCGNWYLGVAPASTSATYRSQLAYLDLPVLYTWGPGSSGQGLYLLAGPQVSIALGQREWLRPTGEAPGSTAEISLPASPRTLAPVTAGLVGGLGYQLANGLGLEVRCSGDLTPVFQAGRGPGCLPASGDGYRNLTLQVQLRYLVKGRRPADPATAHAAATESRPLPAPSAWRPRWASPGPAWPAPDQAPLDSLASDPRLQRVLRILTVLSWLHFEWSPRPSLPGPRPQQWPSRSAPRPLPRRLPERVAVPY
jgi:hypothetical protein